MLVGIHTYQAGKFPYQLEIYEKILEFNGIESIRLNVDDPEFWSKVKVLDLFVYAFNNVTDLKNIAKAIIPVIQNYLNIRCFPDTTTIWPYDDKIKEYYLLKQDGFPIINSYIFWNKQMALKWLDSALFPLVFKLKVGSASRNVILVKDRAYANNLIKKMFGKGISSDRISYYNSTYYKDITVRKILHNIALKIYRTYKKVDYFPLWEKQKNYIMFQDFLPNNLYDTRITVIGGRAFAFRRFNRGHDFRASGSGNIDYDITKIDKKLIEIAFQISENYRFQSMAYDFIYDEAKQPAITEISYIYTTSAVKDAVGYWDKNLNWHSGHFWPQYFHLMDALDLPDLRQPPLTYF